MITDPEEGNSEQRQQKAAKMETRRPGGQSRVKRGSPGGKLLKRVVAHRLSSWTVSLTFYKTLHHNKK